MTTIAQQCVDASSRRLALGMMAAVPLAALMEAIYYFGGVAGTSDDTPVRAAAVATAAATLAAYLVWRFGRRGYGTVRAAKVMALLGLVSVIGFWIGVTFPLALAAVLFGRAALDQGARGPGYAAVTTGAVALVAAGVLCVLGAS
jgi:hypothetical protein